MEEHNFGIGKSEDELLFFGALNFFSNWDRADGPQVTKSYDKYE